VYDLFLHDDAVEAFKKTRGETRRKIRSLIESIAENPFSDPEHEYEDLKGRIVWKFHVNNYMIDLTVDQPMRAVIVLEIRRFR